MKKIAIFLMGLAVMICVVFGALYKADMQRMANNEPVLFSTWKYQYVPSEENGESNKNEPVYIEFDKDSITSRGAMINVINNGEYDIWFGDYFSLERKPGGNWKRLEYINAGEPDWSDINYVVEPMGTAGFSFYWADMYGELEKGEYRVVKLYFSDESSDKINYLYGEFKI